MRKHTKYLQVILSKKVVTTSTYLIFNQDQFKKKRQSGLLSTIKSQFLEISRIKINGTYILFHKVLHRTCILTEIKLTCNPKAFYKSITPKEVNNKNFKWIL